MRGEEGEINADSLLGARLVPRMFSVLPIASGHFMDWRLS